MENGLSHPSDADGPNAELRRSRWATALETFSPIWFTLVMNTGILGILLHELPYQFHGLGVLSTIMFVLSIVLFVVFVFLHLLRVIIFPASALRQTKSDTSDMCLWGCLPIALLTIVAQIALTASTADWGGHAWTLVAYVFWWITTFLMLSVAVVVYIAFCELKAGKEFALPPSIVIPAVGTTTDAVVGSLIAIYATDISSRLAVPMIVVGWLLLGYGFFLGLCIYILALQTFFAKGLYLPPKAWPGLFIFVGPLGQSAAGIQLLATAAEKHFAGYDKGMFLTQESTSSIVSYSTVLALLFIGFDIFWLILSVYAIIKGAIRRQIPFSMIWWSTIFPLATLNTSFLELSMSMNSPTFRVLLTGLLLILFIDYFVCWAFTIHGICKGDILDGRKQLADLARKQE